MMRRPLPLLAAAAVSLALAGPRAAAAHGATHEVERRDAGFAVRVRAHGKRPLAGAAYQVIPPGARDPVREGRTGEDGWVVFAPDVPGTWRVRIADATGHGKVVEVDVREVAGRAEPLASTSTSTSTTTSTTTSTDPTPISTATSTPTAVDPSDGNGPLRVAAGAAAILAVFLALAVLRRRRAGGR